MKLNKNHIIIAIIFLSLNSIILTVVSSYSFKRNELNYINNEMDNYIVNDIYHLYQEEVKSVLEVEMLIKYVDVNLNDDGLEDKIIIIRSPIHSDSHDDTFEILLNNNTTYNRIFRLYSQGWEAIGSVIVLKEVNNGLKNIKIETDKKSIIVRYGRNSYQ